MRCCSDCRLEDTLFGAEFTRRDLSEAFPEQRINSVMASAFSATVRAARAGSKRAKPAVLTVVGRLLLFSADGHLP